MTTELPWVDIPLFDVPDDSIQAETSSSVQVSEIFDYWISQIRPGSRRKPVLSEKRRKLIEKALRQYGADGCYLAIDGCKASEWHMGENPQGVKYNDIELIFRNERNIERFMERAEDRVVGFLEES